MADNYKSPGVYVEEIASGNAPIAGVGTSTAGFIGSFGDTIQVPNPTYDPKVTDTTDPRSKKTVDFPVPTAVGGVVLVTNFSEFKKAFGDFSTDPGQSNLAHAVYGFFANGGTRCYVTRVTPPAGTGTQPGDYTNPPLASALNNLFDPIDEIAIVAAPGLTGSNPYTDLRAFVERPGSTRFAIFDTAEKVDDFSKLTVGGTLLPQTSEHSAVYFPWLTVQDPGTAADRNVPPSGHVAGVYARVDAARGVHKAPANEPVLAVKDVKYKISRAQQDGLNPQGVNCIRKLNGSITVWGARTLGGDGNFKYVNVRRLFDFIHGSVDQGTQWAVFEPNNPDLWARITRNVSAFLSIVWSSGALFGDKREDAFFVKCDAETNPPEKRDLGEVVTEIGVAITRPAEFVIFRLSQKAAS